MASMKKMHKKKILISVVLALIFANFAKADLAKRINNVVSQSLQQGVRFSIHIVEADSDSTAYEHSAEEPMIPASNMKIITTAAALRYLGADYDYKTKVGLCGNTLVIIGSGDPLLGDEQTDSKYGRERGWIFKDIAEVLKHNGVKNIEDIIVDTGVFDNQCVHPSWPIAELNKDYACEVSGLNYNVNCIKVSAENIGGRVNVLIKPQTSFITLINKVKPITSGDNKIGTYRNRHPNKLTVYGECKNEIGPIEVAIEKPAAFFGYLLFEHLTEAGISISGQFTEKILDDANNYKTLTEYKTNIRDCLARCHKDSLGLVAEALLKTIAAVNNPDGKNGSWDRGRELTSEYLLELGIDEDQFYIDDGSGLSRQNELSANTLTTVLLDIYNSENWEMYKDSLAVGGVDGTIAKYFKEETYKGKILGKTGYISGVKSFSGICTTAGGDYIFSILANETNGQTRTVINNIAQAIIDEAADTN